MNERLIPSHPIRFIQECIKGGRVFWTYHVNMRLSGRFISRKSILDAFESYEVVEAYPDDKYLPSYLVLGRTGANAFHVVIAVDVLNDNIRIVTAYHPDSGEWRDDLKTRRTTS
jgi:hypothetical protein